MKKTSLFLRKDREEKLINFFLEIKEEFAEEQSVDFSMVRKRFINKRWGLLHAFRTRSESKEEFYDVFYEMLWDDFIQQRSLRGKRLSFLLLYIFAGTAPLNAPPPSIDLIRIQPLLDFASVDSEAKDILSLLFENQLIIFNLFAGSKTIQLTNKGIIKTGLKAPSSVVLTLNAENCLLNCSEKGFTEQFERDSRLYLKAKEKFLREYVENDESELIDYDLQTHKVTKKTSKGLNHFRTKDFEAVTQLLGGERKF